MILVPFAIGVSFTPVIFTVNVWVSLKLPSLELTVKVSVAFDVRAFIAFALGTYTYLPLSAPVLTTYSVPYVPAFDTS